jgi:hypothetical protein
MRTRIYRHRKPGTLAIRLVALWLTMGSALGNNQTTIPVQSQGDTLVAAKTDKLIVQVKITTHEMQIGKPSDARPDVIESNCTYSKYPCSIVDRIDIIVNGKSLDVPRSAFCDLADLTTARINVGKSVSILRLSGGDGAESFIVKIEFDTNQVKRRTLAGGESGGQLSEDTRYHVVVFN